MNAKLVLISMGLAAGLAAGCDRSDKTVVTAPPAVPPQGNLAPLPQISSSAQASQKSSTPPIQGDVDTKQPEQRRDYEAKTK